MQCSLSYIPKHLHSIGKEIVDEFFVGEELYYRCNVSECQKPYQNISLYDVSHNRNFKNNKEFPKEDVLYDINEETKDQLITNKEISVSIIKSLSENKTFEKEIVCDKDEELVAKIKLIHKPVPCMYPHCVFEISLNDIIITKENYPKTLKKKSVKYKNLRRDIKLELTAIIYSEIIDNDSEIEIITEL